MNERREQALAKWRVLVGEQEQSGQSVAAFCQTRELPRSQLIYWKRRLREAQGAPFVEVQLAQPGAEPRVKARALGSTTIEVRLKNGRSLMVAASFDARHLRALLAVVESC
jgi:transposase-like protein